MKTFIFYVQNTSNPDVLGAFYIHNNITYKNRFYFIHLHQFVYFSFAYLMTKTGVFVSDNGNSTTK